MQYNKNNPLSVITLCSGYDSHLRILYGYAKWARGDGYETRIHCQINANYKDCMLHYKLRR